MAINITHEPQRINPSGNLNTWVINSDEPNLLYYYVTVEDAYSLKRITRKKLYPKPNTVNNTVMFNVSDALKEASESVLITNNNVINITKAPAYTIMVEEVVKHQSGMNGTEWGTHIGGWAVGSLDRYHYFDSQLNVIDYVGYHSNTYNINNDPEKKAKFLSNDQTVKRITTTQKEYLKIFNIDKIATKMLVQLYDTDGDFLESVTIGIPDNSEIEFPVVSINVTPSVILNHSSISADTKSIAGQYKVTLLSATDVEVSESRLYIMYEDKCTLKETNVIYKNIMGGYDSVKFLNRIETINVSKTYLNTAMNKGITYSTDGKYLNNKDVITTDVVTSYLAFSDWLDDYESKQIKQLIMSPKVYVVVNNLLVEVTVENKTYKVSQRHTNGGKKNRLELQFTAPFSIDKLEEVLSLSDIPLNNNPDPSYYLTINGDFVVDDQGRYITLKY